MDSDKGLLLREGKSWARIMADKLSALDIPFKISINKDQADNYRSIFDEPAFIIDDTNLPGPLRGILSAHQEYPETNWLILACDMVDMDQETLEGILNATKEVPGKEFYVYRNDTHYEPFGGIYTASGLRKVYDAYCKNELMNFSLQYVLNSYETHVLLSKNETPFRNYNTL